MSNKIKIPADEPIRADQAVTIGPYTFKDRDTKEVINLATTFIVTAVYCDIKRKGDAYSAGTRLTGAVLVAGDGTVRVVSHAFDTPGTWTYQFICENAGGAELIGEPVEFTVAKNTRDLGTLELFPAA